VIRKSVRHRLRRAKRLSKPEPEIDTSGMSPTEETIHAIEKYGLAALIRDYEPPAVAQPLPGTADATVEMPEAAPEAAPAAEEMQPAEAPAPATLQEPSPWYEEYSQWRTPGAPDPYDYNEHAGEDDDEWDPFEVEY
jgi:hypothetical protein